MFESYFCPRVVARLRRHRDIGIIESFLGYVHQQGHGRLTIQQYVREVEVYLTALRRQQRPLTWLTEESERRFALGRKSRRPQCIYCKQALM